MLKAVLMYFFNLRILINNCKIILFILVYLFSSSSLQCQQLSNFSQFAFGQLKITDSSLFLIGCHPTSYNLNLYKLTFSNTVPDWVNKLICSSSSCSTWLSESLLVLSFIYSFFIYGNTRYLYFVKMSVADGTVNFRYKSSTICTSGVSGSTLNGDYLMNEFC